MDEIKLTDISEICEQFNVSSRTLRFYEEEGIIESTRSIESARRKYTPEQINRIREVLTLRNIGISVKEIKDYLKGNLSLKEIVHLKKAEIIALIDSKMHVIEMLNQTLMAIDDEENIFDAKASHDTKYLQKETAMRMEIVQKCAQYIVQGAFGKLYPFFSKQLQAYMPEAAFRAVWQDGITGGGKLLKIGEAHVSDESSDVIFQSFIFEKLNLQVKFVFRNLVIHGLWTSYEE